MIDNTSGLAHLSPPATLAAAGRAAAWVPALASAAVIALALSSPPAHAGGGFSPVPLPCCPGIPGWQFPEAEVTLLNWVSFGDEASINLHSWGLWTALNQDSGQTFGGQALRIWETWQTPSQIISGLQTQPWPLDGPHQSSDPILVSVRYSPQAASHAATQGLFDTAVLDALIDNGQTAIPPFPNQTITLKPVILPETVGDVLDVVQPNDLYRLPFWDGPPGVPAAHGPTTWNQWVWVDLNEPGNGTGDGSVDLTGNTPTPQNTYGLGRFIHFTTQEAVGPVVRIIVGMHVGTREMTRWTWSTFWWSATPDNPQAPSSASVAAQRPAQLTGAPRNYAMCNAYQMVDPTQPNTGGTNSGVSPVICYNPWLEAGFGPAQLPATNPLIPNPNYGVQTNCMSCHANARYPAAGFAGYTAAQYIDIGPALPNQLRLDFAWSVDGNAVDTCPDKELLVCSFGGNQVLEYDGVTGAFISVQTDGNHGGLIAPEGMTYGPDGNLYVTSFGNDQVRRYNGATGAFIDAFVTAGSGGLDQPVDLQFGPDGNLYVSSQGSNEVLRYNGATGAFIDAFTSAGSGGVDRVGSATFGPDGNLYVNSTRTDEVLRYNGATGAFIDAFVTAGSGGLEQPVGGLIFGPDGNLYVNSVATDEVLRYNGATGAFINAFVSAGSGGMDRPTDLFYGPDGNLYVTSHFSAEVLRYNGATGAFIDAFVTAGSGGLDDPVSGAFGPDGHLYVADHGEDDVLRYNGATGAFIDVFVSDGSSGLKLPDGLAGGADGNLYVSSAGSDEVLRYNSVTGAFIDAFVSANSGGLDDPRRILFGPDGNLYVASSATKEVLRYNGATGAFIDAFVSSGSGGLDYPIGLVFGPDGNLYVTSLHTDEVLRYNGATGAFIDAFVSSGSGGMDGPTGLAFGPDGNLYLCAVDPDEVLRYNGATGAFIDVFVTSGSGGLVGPRDLRFSLLDGNLYVSSFHSDQVLRYNGATGAFLDAFVSAGSGGLDGPTALIFFQCVEVTAACCLEDGNCLDVTEAECAKNGGTPQDPGSVCTGVQCPQPDCPGEGNCFTPHPTPGCNDAGCCDAVCAIDPFCCQQQWDQLCADEAQQLCGNPACGQGGNCFIAHPTPGCNNDICCKKVCLIDPSCCSIDWDAVCVDQANRICDGCLADTNLDGIVDVNDLVNVIVLWSTDGNAPGIKADINKDGVVDVNDLVLVIVNWGPCP